MHGIVSAHRAATKAGVDMIPGLRANVFGEDLVLLAGDDAAWADMLKIASRDVIGEHEFSPSPGMWAIVPVDAPLSDAIERRDPSTTQRLSQLSERFSGRLSIELAPSSVNVLDVSQATGIPVVAGNSPIYTTPGDAFITEVYQCVGARENIRDLKRHRITSTDRWLCDESWYRKRTDGADIALRRAQQIAEACEFRVPTTTRPYMPVAHWIDGCHDRAFVEMAKAGLASRGLAGKREYDDRLQTELDVLTSLGWSDYFLVVEEFVGWAKDNGIPVGPGRGSGAGSLVAYALRITDLDPLPYGLLFERFLNPERVSIPDFDIDFCDRNRGRVIQHVVDLHGKERVAQIAALGNMKTRSTLKDVARFFCVDPSDVNRATKPIEDTYCEPIEQAIKDFGSVAAFVSNHPMGKHIASIATRLHMMPKSLGIHAAGVVIADCDMVSLSPLCADKDGNPVIQFDKEDIDDVGIVKFDFLGLSTMRTITRAAELSGTDPASIDLDDPETMKVFARGDTEYVFQFESSGMRNVLANIEPERFDDVMAAVALHRPGPMESGMEKEFIERRHGRSTTGSIHPMLDDVLAETRGVLCYQEQVMKAAQILAGYTLGGADLLRRAMGKKKVEAMAKERVKFIDGCVANGVDESRAGEIFGMIEEFAKYGFNKSHSAAYAYLSVQAAWLKHNHLVEFAASHLESCGSPEKVAKCLRWIRSLGIELINPSINGPVNHCDVIDGRIAIGLDRVKGVGDAAIRSIVSARKSGKFTSMGGFISRVDQSVVNSTAMKSLACVGAFDCLGIERSSAYAFASKVKQPKSVASGQMAFGIPIEVEIPSSEPWSNKEALEREDHAIGCYLSGHPADALEDTINSLSTPINRIASMRDREHVTVAGIIHDVGVKVPKRAGRKPYGFWTLEGPRGQAIHVSAYSEAWDDVRPHIEDGKAVILECAVRRINPRAVPSLVVLSVHEMRKMGRDATSAVRPLIVSGEYLFVDFSPESPPDGYIRDLRNTINRIGGSEGVPVRIRLRAESGDDVTLELGKRVKVTDVDKVSRALRREARIVDAN